MKLILLAHLLLLVVSEPAPGPEAATWFPPGDDVHVHLQLDEIVAADARGKGL